MKIHEILSQAPDLWCQKTIEKGLPDGRTAFCLYGWCLNYPVPARNEVIDLIDEAIGGEGIVEWNDRPERTVAEVIQVCKNANV